VTMKKIYVQYGCGLSAPLFWRNFDVSPTLRLQKMPLLGGLIKGKLNTVFPDNVEYGDIIKGLPVADNSCDGVYCSHTLEHLSFNDCKIALKNTYAMLRPNGIFRCIVPDLEILARNYLSSLSSGNKNAGNSFMEQTLLGIKVRPRGLKKFVTSYLGNSHHLWMWDQYSLEEELNKAGFASVRVCKYNDSADIVFAEVESEGRFINSICLEAVKL